MSDGFCVNSFFKGECLVSNFFYSFFYFKNYKLLCFKNIYIGQFASRFYFIYGVV
jgi:hypothetical protein